MQLPQFGATVKVHKEEISRVFGWKKTRTINQHALRLQKALQKFPDSKVRVDIGPSTATCLDEFSSEPIGKERIISARILVAGEDNQIHGTQINQKPWFTRAFGDESMYSLFRRIKKTTRQFVETYGLQKTQK